jgi:hypothetical protein
LDIAGILPAVGRILNGSDTTAFWIKTITLVVFVIFGYQTPNLIRIASGKFVREKFADSLLGFFMGAVNGFLIVGCIWYFMDQANYPFQPAITPAVPPPPIIAYLPPNWLDGLVLYFGLLVAFLFILIVFI